MAVSNGDQTVAEPPEPQMQSYDAATRATHADDFLRQTTDVAPPIHVSTTFSHPTKPEDLIPGFANNLLDAGPSVEAHIYSRASAPSSTRLEAILSSLCGGYAMTYSSGLSAFHGLLTYFNPKVVAIGAGYFGCHGVLGIHTKLSGAQKVDIFDEKSWDAAGLGKGDVVHLETPVNPTGQAFNIEEIAAKAHARGAYLSVDATLAPPSLLDPFKHGADIVMYSGTKYIGGHSDMLCGVLVVPRERFDWWKGLFYERMYLGSVLGSLEAWLGLRSIRTLELRVRQQSSNTEKLVRWFDECLNGEGDDAEIVKNVVWKVQHASLQTDDMPWLKKQMPNGFGPLFAVWMKTEVLAKTLPSKLHVFHHATSLGGVESLIEWRHLPDPSEDPRLLRVSVGIESADDLISDFRTGLKDLAASQ